MKETFAKKLEVATTIAIIVVAFLFGAFLVKKFLLTDSAPAHTPKDNIAVESKVNTPPVDWSKNGGTLLLVLSTDCHFCNESVPFYQKLSRQTADNDKLKIVAAFSQDTTASEEYLKSNGVTVSQTYQADPPAIGVGGTPYLLLIDQDGKVIKTWFGKQSADEETKILEQIRNPEQSG